jgi:hypothetical protein
MKMTSVYQRKRRAASRWYNKLIKSPAWLLAFLVASAACLGTYVANVIFGRVHPSTTWGWGYGIAATVLFVGTLVYGLRRRLMRFRPGRTFHYLQFHVYGGTLFLLLVFMHTGFQVPHGVLTWWLWFFSLWIVLSGLVGVVLQKWIPTMLASDLNVEVNYDRIPDLTEELRERAETLASESGPEIRRWYRRKLADGLDAPRFRPLYFVNASAGRSNLARQLEHLRRVLPAEQKEELDELEEIVSAKHDIDAHYTLQTPLRWWLVLHLPVGLLLIALIGLHIFTVLYY